MDEIGLKLFCPYNIILVAQFGKKARGNISTCESHDLGFLDVFYLRRKSPTIGSLKLRFLEIFLSSDVNVLTTSFE
jgi:hypothetical protein